MADFTLSDIAKMQSQDMSLDDVRKLTAKTQAPQSTDQVGDALSAFGHHAMNALHGGAQFVENTVAAGANLLPDNPVSRAISRTAASDNQAMKGREAQYQASTPDNFGSYAGAAAGEVAPFLVGGVARGLQAAGDVVGSLASKVGPWASRFVSGTTQGGIVGAASPVTSGDYWDQKGKDVGGSAALGGSIPLVGGAVKSLYQGGKNAFLPIVSPSSVVGPTVSNLIGSDPAALAALQKPQQLVPGSMPTTAQLLATPQAVATEKTFANTSPDFKIKLAERSNANNDARLAAVSSVAKTPEEIAAAIAARKSAASGWIGPEGKLANGAPVDATPVLQALDALKQSPLGIRPTIGGAANDIASTIRASATTDPTTGQTMIAPGHMDAVRQNVREFLARHAPNGAVGSQQEAAFEPIRNAITDQIEGANPGYRAYLADYAKNSRPINTMEAAGGILDNVGGAGRGANTSGVPQVTLARYSSALKQAQKTPFGLDPEAQKALEAVQADLQRASISHGLTSPGSDTAFNLQAPGWLAGKLYGDNFTGTPSGAKVAGGLLGAMGGWVGGGGFGAAGGATAGVAAANKLGQFGQKRVNEMFAKALTDPEFAAQLAAEFRASQQKAPGLLKSIPQLGLLGN